MGSEARGICGDLVRDCEAGVDELLVASATGYGGVI